MEDRTPYRAVLRALLSACAVACLVLVPVGSAIAGDPNAGDVWVDNVGQPSGPGHEQDPHLACQDINLWGNDLADSSGNYTIDGWPPSGSGTQAYSSNWSYDQNTGGNQVLDVISVQTLIEHAIANGDVAQPNQGFHFKLEFSADPNKHKTFWVNCQVPAIVTHASSATVGQAIHDQATLSGGNSPSGSITWNVYSASDKSCSTPLNTSPLTAPVSGDGTYTSPGFTPASPGSYQWVATYSGDAGNLSVSTSCSDPNEVSLVTKASPGIATSAASGTIGGPINDVARLSGGHFPSGTISWNVYRASDKSCSTPLNKSPLTATVSGDGNYTSPDFTPSAPGSYQWVATYSGDANNNSAATDCNDPNEVSTVSKGSPKVATSASSAPAGQPLVDVATLSGGDSPTGSISWNVYTVSDTKCATPVNTSPLTTTVHGDGSYTSPGFTPTTAGSYQWVATYSGDANNNQALTKCNDPNEISTVGQTTPAIATTASSATAGGSIHDVATLSGGDAPTGSISWKVYSASDTSCSTALNQTPLTAPVNGAGTYTSPNYTPTSAGSYQWVATYAGDQNNSKVASHCNDPDEVSTVSKASPAIATTASSGTIGGSIHDVAKLSGGDGPTGTISWNVYSANDASCSTPLNASPLTAPVNGAGTYTSPDFTPSSAGSYQWVATYSGDPNNNQIASHCNDPNEVSTVSPAGPAIVTNASSGTVGGSVHDTATLSGGFSPTGTISWSVYRVSDKSCSTPLNASSLTAPVHGDGTYTSPDFTPSAAGSYQWVATYSGDGNNKTVASQCNDPNEVSTVGTAPAPGIHVLKLQRVGSSGSFTTAPVTAQVGQTIQYEIQVTNTGNVPLTLSLSDPHCAAGTISAATLISGTLSGNVLSPGSEAQYTCSHVLTANDASPFTNTATVTGQPPSGPPVSGVSSVSANKQAVLPVTIKKCPKGKVKRTKKVHGKKVIVCVAKKHSIIARRPIHPAGFTG